MISVIMRIKAEVG